MLKEIFGAALIFFAQVVLNDNGLGFGLDSYAAMLPDVAPEMLCAEFWVNKLSDPDSVIMSLDEIAAFNQAVIKRLPRTVCDLTAYPASCSREKLLRILTEKPFPEGVLYAGMTPVTPDYLVELERSMNLEDIKKKNDVRYAFTVRRSSIRSFPTHDVATRKPDEQDVDLFQETAVEPAEPVLVLHQSSDGRWYFVQMYNYRGWIPAEDVAVAKSRAEWFDYINIEDFLVVTGSKIRLGVNPYSPELSGLEFGMGTRLPLVECRKAHKDIDQRLRADSYIVKLPVRGKEGELVFKLTNVSKSSDVSKGYLTYTRANIIRQALKMQGERYGWGGMFQGRDCSALIQDTYRSFGFKLPRNACEQELSPGKTVRLEGASIAERQRIVQTLLPGAALYMPGHVMLYLGAHGKRPYVIHALSAYGDTRKKLDDGTLFPILINRVVVSDLSLPRRLNGRHLLESLTVGKQFEF